MHPRRLPVRFTPCCLAVSRAVPPAGARQERGKRWRPPFRRRARAQVQSTVWSFGRFGHAGSFDYGEERVTSCEFNFPSGENIKHVAPLFPPTVPLTDLGSTRGRGQPLDGKLIVTFRGDSRAILNIAKRVISGPCHEHRRPAVCLQLNTLPSTAATRALPSLNYATIVNSPEATLAKKCTSGSSFALLGGRHRSDRRGATPGSMFVTSTPHLSQSSRGTCSYSVRGSMLW